VWRCVLVKIATLQEIESHWSILDLADANDALDIRDETEGLMAERQKAQMKG